VVDGSYYYPNFSICPGSHWVGVTWNGLLNGTSWSVTPGITYTANNTICNFNLPSNGFSAIAITVNGSNTCGTGWSTSFYLSKKTFGCGAYLMSVSPNPSSQNLRIKTSIKYYENTVEENIITDNIELLDDSNNIIISLSPGDSELEIDTNQIRNGLYFLRAKFGEEIIIKRVIIKK
jgi:hypothetical protein